MDQPAVTLYWIPVAAGTKLPFQRWSLAVYEFVAAKIARRKRCTLVHSALKLRVDGETLTLELTPIPRKQTVAPLMTGPVGTSLAGRLRIFRYQLLCLRADALPDEEWAVSQLALSTDASLAHRILDLAPAVPAYTWGRRIRGTTEMWTSDSASSWLLTHAGLDTGALEVPRGGRAPGWRAGIEAASLALAGHRDVRTSEA